MSFLDTKKQLTILKFVAKNNDIPFKWSDLPGFGYYIPKIDDLSLMQEISHLTAADSIAISDTTGEWIVSNPTVLKYLAV